jgi:hypothetical protein
MIMTPRRILLMLLIAILLPGCKKDTAEPVSLMQCVPVRFVGSYCPTKMPTHLVRFLKPTEYATKVDTGNGAGFVYMAAVINLPKEYQKRDTIFQLQFHYDPKVERQNQPLYCQMNLTLTKMVVYDNISNTPCP